MIVCLASKRGIWADSTAFAVDQFSAAQTPRGVGLTEIGPGTEEGSAERAELAGHPGQGPPPHPRAGDRLGGFPPVLPGLARLHGKEHGKIKRAVCTAWRPLSQQPGHLVVDIAQSQACLPVPQARPERSAGRRHLARQRAASPHGCPAVRVVPPRCEHPVSCCAADERAHRLRCRACRTTGGCSEAARLKRGSGPVLTRPSPFAMAKRPR